MNEPVDISKDANAEFNEKLRKVFDEIGRASCRERV